MSIQLDKIVVGSGESIFVNIQGSVERSLFIAVSEDGRCFVSGPFNNLRKVYELKMGSMEEVSLEERQKVLGF